MCILLHYFIESVNIHLSSSSWKPLIRWIVLNLDCVRALKEKSPTDLHRFLLWSLSWCLLARQRSYGSKVNFLTDLLRHFTIRLYLWLLLPNNIGACQRTHLKSLVVVSCRNRRSNGFKEISGTLSLLNCLLTL